MKLNEFENKLQQKNINLTDFIVWFNREFLVMDNTGAFHSNIIGVDSSRESVYQKMYDHVYDYIQDPAFKDDVLQLHLSDYQDRGPGESKNAISREMLPVDRAEAHVKAMASLIGKLTWGAQSIPTANIVMENKKPFFRWLFGPSENAPEKMNCWECVFYAAWGARLISKQEIIAMITVVNNQPMRFVKLIKSSSDKREVKKGDIVIFGDDGQHVALATSEKGDIFELDADTDGIQKSTIDTVRKKKSAYSAVRWGSLF
ncbi:hypothetical protein [Dickeya chrysanthemi]|uniref:CHAP domain-containing protein n=1 Tax=Dickeya chrysanthemi TaxID=556 RepID=A0ABU8JSV1_DICCH|nr:hypothetical protein [Dickeya chrysanthemi]MCA7009528.1 hypothetical protein [Dickeya chrysanthemi]